VKGQPLRFLFNHHARAPEVRAKISATNKAKNIRPPASAGRPRPRPRPRGQTLGSQYVDGDGYVRVCLPGHPMADGKGYVREHRFVMVARTRRMLMKKEHVHHVNEDKSDNRLENLWLWPDRASHVAWHEMQKRGHELNVSMPAIRIGRAARVGNDSR
jgi:hypothetical protein